MNAVVTSRLRVDVAVAVLGVCAAPFVGYALALIGRRAGAAGPLAMVLVVLVPAWLLAVVARPALAVGSVLLLLPMGLTEVPGLPLQFAQVLILVGAGLVALRRIALGGTLLGWSAPLSWVAALAVWLLVATPSAVDFAVAQREVIVFTIGLLFMSLIGAVGATTAAVRSLLVPMVVAVAGVAVTTLGGASQAQAQFGGAVVRGRALGSFGQPNELGTFCAVGALVAVGLVFGARTARGRMVAALATGVIVLGLLLSLSRGAWIGFFVGVCVLLATLREARRVLLVSAVPTLLLALAVGAFAPSSPQVEVVGARLRSITGEANPYDNRPAIWREAMALTAEDPLTGQGPGSFPLVSARMTSDVRTTFAHHAHNLVLTLSSENGIPAVAFVTGLAVHLAVLSRRARRAARRDGRPHDAVVIAALTAAGAAVIAQGLVDYTLRNAVLLVQVCAVVGALAAATRAELRRAPA